jgi:hypothetical protein
MAGVTFHLDRCPHCGSDAQVRDHAVYRYQCMACGNPRIPTDARWLTPPNSVTQDLKSVRSHHVQRGIWSAASWLMWVVASLCALFGGGTAWSLDFGVPGWTFVTILALIPAVLAVVARLTAGKQSNEARARLEEAWRKIAVHFFAQSPTGRSLADVKAAFGVETESALRLLAEGEVASLLDGDAALDVAQSANFARVRVQQASGQPAEDTPDMRQEPEEEPGRTSELAAGPARHK